MSGLAGQQAGIGKTAKDKGGAGKASEGPGVAESPGNSLKAEDLFKGVPIEDAAEMIAGMTLSATHEERQSGIGMGAILRSAYPGYDDLTAYNKAKLRNMVIVHILPKLEEKHGLAFTHNGEKSFKSAYIVTSAPKGGGEGDKKKGKKQIDLNYELDDERLIVNGVDLHQELSGQELFLVRLLFERRSIGKDVYSSAGGIDKLTA